MQRKSKDPRKVCKQPTRLSLTDSEKLSLQKKLANHIETKMVTSKKNRSCFRWELGVSGRTLDNMVSKKPHEPLISSVEKLLFLFQPLDIGEIGLLLTNRKSATRDTLSEEEKNLLSIFKQLKISSVRKFIEDHEQASVDAGVKEKLKVKIDLLNTFSGLDLNSLKLALNFIRQLQS